MRLLTILTTFFVIACGPGQEDVSAVLREAGALQNAALKAYFEMESEFSKSPSACQTVITGLKSLRNEMIDIPGLPHDHTYCNGQHKTSDIPLSDAEMLDVQREWHDSMFAKIELLRNCRIQNGQSF